MEKSLQTPSGYHEFLQELKGRIRTAQVRAALAVNRELVLLYWSIGRDILAKQGTEGWGTRVIDRLAHDLQSEFPGIEGFRVCVRTDFVSGANFTGCGKALFCIRARL